MLGLHLVWCLWLNQKPIIFQDAREGLGRLIKALKNRQSAMECLHGLPASSTVTQKGTFWFCAQRPSCEFFCPDQDCYMFGKATTAYRESGCIHPRCYGHERLAKMRMVKDTNNQNYGRPFFVGLGLNWNQLNEKDKKTARYLEKYIHKIRFNSPSTLPVSNLPQIIREYATQTLW